jgi:hypothetical protein
MPKAQRSNPFSVAPHYAGWKGRKCRNSKLNLEMIICKYEFGAEEDFKKSIKTSIYPKNVILLNSTI